MRQSDSSNASEKGLYTGFLAVAAFFFLLGLATLGFEQPEVPAQQLAVAAQDVDPLTQLASTDVDPSRLFP
ncbi:MAG: hypothetical protein AAF560_17370 [Acidobacteriota bacterium]